MAMDLGKAFRFGAISGVALAILSFLVKLIIPATAKIQFALIEAPLTATVGIPASGTALINTLTRAVGFTQTGMIINILTVIIAGGLAVVVGRLVYNIIHTMLKIGMPKGQTGRLTLLLLYSGIVGGIILGTISGIPAIGTAITLGASALVTAFVLLAILNLKAIKDIKFIKDSLITL